MNVRVGHARAFQVVAALLCAAALATPLWAESGSAAESATVDTLLARAGRAAEAGDVGAARTLYESILEASPEEHRALNGLAVVGLTEGDHDRAIEFGKRAVKADETNAQYHFILATGYGMKASLGGLRAMYYAGKFKNECKKAIEHDPEHLDANVALFFFYAYAPSIVGGGMDRARERSAMIASFDAYHGHLTQAVIAKLEEDMDSAETLYLAAVSVDSMNAEGWSYLGTFYQDTDRPLDAVGVFERVRGLAPDDLVAVYQLARAHAEAGDDLVAAEEGFKAFIAAEDRPDEPELASAHWRLGLVYESMERYDEAMAQFDEAIRLDPEHTMAIESRERVAAERQQTMPGETQ